MPLVAHLRGEILLESQFGHGASFLDGTGEALLAKHVQPGPKGAGGGGGMDMVGRGDDDRVGLAQEAR